jgi:hypothetical protein
LVSFGVDETTFEELDLLFERDEVVDDFGLVEVERGCTTDPVEGASR